MVTAGPGLTNIVTAMGGAYLESRELLVIGGQVKVPDLARGEVRQRGIQEIDGVAIARPITEKAILMEQVVDRATFAEMIRSGVHGRKGPVFVELPLDVQGAQVDEEKLDSKQDFKGSRWHSCRFRQRQSICISTMLREARRPVLLLGGRGSAGRRRREVMDKLAVLGGSADDDVERPRPGSAPNTHSTLGGPNTWGQRSANILMQQADLLGGAGDAAELAGDRLQLAAVHPGGQGGAGGLRRCASWTKGHPRVDVPVCGDANAVLRRIAAGRAGQHCTEWVEFCRERARGDLPLDGARGTRPARATCRRIVFAEELSDLCDLRRCGGFRAAAEARLQWRCRPSQQKRGQRIAFNNGGLASMGYGSGGAIGAAVAAGGRRTVLIEGDGGFMQNLQELGTVRAQKLNLKIFLFDDNGYASIRMTQSNYFGGRYVGCDIETGLGIPNWEPLFAAYDIPVMRIGPGFESDPEFLQRFNAVGARAFLVKIDPMQTYFPKISSRVTASGGMESNPLHRMTPDSG